MYFLQKRILLILLYILTYQVASKAESITIYCPAVKNIQILRQIGVPWANYKYIAQVAVEMPELGNHLQFGGEGNANNIDSLQAATWTDRTFLCVYNTYAGSVVIFEIELAKYIRRCYFENAKGQINSECLSSDPSQCPITCEMGQPGN